MKAATCSRKNRGFTLSEMLLAVAILVVLIGLAMIPITRHQRTLRQTELDGKAETVYMAAQNRISQLQASGRKSDYAKEKASPLENIPWDAEEGNSYTKDTLYYVTSDSKLNERSAAYYILPQDQVERELWEQNWVIEYNPESGSIYAVFFSEKPMDYSFNGYNELRSYSQRLQNGAVVGYYGGESVLTEQTYTLSPKVEIINAEKLLLQVECKSPREPLHFYVTVTDSYGRSTGRFELLDRVNGDTVDSEYLTYRATMVLDSLSGNMRFGEQSRFSALTPGADLTLKVEVECNNRLVDSWSGEYRTNSLFAELRENGSVAVVTYARHLQNLDQGSGLTDTVTRAVQEQDIRFVTNMADGWDGYYPNRKFTPIENSNLTAYDSTVTVGGLDYHPVIYGLTVNTAGNGGLFRSFAGTLNHIRLCGANINATRHTGGLVGSISGSTVINGCQVYLSRTWDNLDDKDQNDIWLQGGNYVGGLVGESRYNLTVTDSFAASVLQGRYGAGGLVGYAASGRTDITRSYADCYLYATDRDGAAGGLLGGCDGAAVISLTDCYAAGFQSAVTTAGLVAGTLDSGDSVNTCYTVCTLLSDNRLTYSTVKPVGDTAAKPLITKTYYMEPGEQNAEGTAPAKYEDWSGTRRAYAVQTFLNDSFTAETGGSYTVPYNLLPNMGLSTYSYPRLRSLTHYGDWQAEFESGALVYYEKYLDGSYGFRGANKNEQMSTAKTVVGDGYGMVYKVLPDTAPEVVCTVDGVEGTVFLDLDTAVSVGEYSLLPLPTHIVNPGKALEEFYIKLQVEGTTYYFNPDFACTPTEGSTTPAALNEISVRTARHLNNLSRYYAEYRSRLLPAGTVTFRQERPIDYGSYEWVNYSAHGSVTVQQPIGTGTDSPFTDVYDGGSYPIAAAVDLQSASGSSYVGLFGINRGTVRNVVLTTGETQHSVSLTDIITMRTACIGTLAGLNQGTVYNCASAGFSISGNAYEGSILYIGGFVGSNTGVISACSVSSPYITANSTYARMYAGGFVGSNSRTITQSYAIADIEIVQIRGGGAVLSGFAGENTGSVRNSYCTTALTSPGADTHGFAPTGGGISNCYYLTGGTYRFVGKVHLYEYKDSSGAKGVNESGLQSLRGSIGGFGSVSSGHSYHHGNTEKSEGTAYPYPGSIMGRLSSRVHYGDWVTKADLGTLGMVYWEYEEGGSNPGYHFSYLGVESGVTKTGSSLCTAHDDDGKITAYGYGYYRLKDYGGETTLTCTNMGGIAESSRDARAEQELEKQMPQFVFVAYRTGEDGIYLASSTSGNAVWSLSQPELSVKLDYAVSPFFGNAYGFYTDVGEKLGEGDSPYEVRSVEQLQYINWSYCTENGEPKGSVTRDVTESASVYKFFPYLQFYNVNGNQTSVDAVLGDRTHGTRPVRTWNQTHDLNGADLENPTAADKNYSFHPIAGAVGNVANVNNTTYNVKLYNWFGSIYDGGNYYIKNVNVDSYCYNVGIFGTVAGAKIRNIVLYSDNSGYIRRTTDATPSTGATEPKNYITSYALGGLVGIATNYTNTKDGVGVGEITNCAVAGYKIVDNSKNRQSLGEAVVGGLVGVSNINLNKCSAVVKLEINCTHRNAGAEMDDASAVNSAMWGNYIRVGGLVGGVHEKVTDCYTGGSITVGADTLKEHVKNDKKTFADTGKSEQFQNQDQSTYVYLGGIGGSGFSASFTNFSINNDGYPSFENCYTYITFPAMQGTITGISLIGGLADRAGVNDSTASLTVTNCYYLNSSANIDFSQLPKYYTNQNSSNSLSSLLGTKAEQDKMLNGNLNYLKRFIPNKGGTNTYNLNGLYALTYNQMSARTGANITLAGGQTVRDSFVDALNNGVAGGSFGWVTTEEAGAEVHGKYSFPGDNAQLEGQNYPFPTILHQETRSFGTANLHYGEWPSSGLYWSLGLLKLDKLLHYDAASGQSIVLLDLIFANEAVSPAGTPTLSIANPDIVSAELLSDTPDANGHFPVRVTGRDIGSTVITATWGNYTARLAVEVTSELKISASPAAIDLYVGDAPISIALTARDSQNNVLSGVTWNAVSATNRIVTVSPVSSGQFTVAGKAEGEETILVTATYRRGTQEFTSSLLLTANIHMQGVLGIAAQNGEAGLDTAQLILNKEATGEDTGGADFNFPPYSDTPDYAGSALYLYSRGKASDLANFRVEDITVTAPDGSPIAQEDCIVTAGAVIPAEQEGGFVYLPLTVLGKQTGQIRVTVTLRDLRTDQAYVLTVPYTLREEDTQVTAKFMVGDNSITRKVPFGSSLNDLAEEGKAFDLTEAEWESLGGKPENFERWENTDSALVADTEFHPVYKTEQPDTPTP